MVAASVINDSLVFGNGMLTRRSVVSLVSSLVSVDNMPDLAADLAC